MIAIVHSIYSQSVQALALNAGSVDNDAVQYCMYISLVIELYVVDSNMLNYYTIC